MWCHDGMMSSMWIGGLFWLLIAAAGIVLLVWLVGRGRTGDDSPPGSSTDRALSILRERLASGEIDETEYRTRLRLLTEPEP